MADFEKLGVFYLGRPYDLTAKRPRDGLLLYDSRDLTTHAVCVGMTGSGKTGLCLALLEEAAIDGVPAILIDPKGDLGNLLLTFPALEAAEFQPWVDADAARRRDLAPEGYAREQAEAWKAGLAAWGQDGRRIRRLRDAADFAIYTPGSNAGLEVSIVASFAAPPPALRADAEALRDRVGATATSLLGLLGIEADPIKSREHILLSTILDACWREGRDLDLAALIQQIQTPPVSRVGVLELETFYPATERFALAMALNNLLAAPGFGAWLGGDPLDVGRMLWTPAGKPRVSIFSIAHLNDAERMFFVSLLLNETLAWVRTQPGTTSLRAILYMDELAGFLPPVANPPSKPPLLTLLKQARAFGLGVVLATQNPVDLDYKALANTGTWFIGRLQTERDKARLLDGLEGVATGRRFDRQEIERTIAALGSRIFLMSNVHDDAPEVFETRWAMSYLRGPLTRTEIRTLMAARKAAAAAPEVVPAAAPPGPAAAAPAAPDAAAVARTERPVLPPDVPEYFLPAPPGNASGSPPTYHPMILGAAQVRFADARKGIDTTREVAFLTPVGAGPLPVEWDAAVAFAGETSELARAPAPDARFAELPAPATRAKSYPSWSRDFATWLQRTQVLELLKSPATGELSHPSEPERDFRIRLQQTAREVRDHAVARLRQRYAPKIARLQERVRRAEQAVAREAEQVEHHKAQTVISLGATLLGAFMGRKAVSASTLGRATTAARGVGRTMKERQDVDRARETVEALQRQLADLEAEFEAEAAALAASGDPRTEALAPVVLTPARAGIAVRLLALTWAP